MHKDNINGLQLPGILDHTVVQHNVGHRIVCSTIAGWTYQYHVNKNSVRIDRFASNEQIYDQFCENRAVFDGNFGNGIEGNGTRSIRKLTFEGAASGIESFQQIAEESVTIMQEIYAL